MHIQSEQDALQFIAEWRRESKSHSRLAGMFRRASKAFEANVGLSRHHADKERARTLRDVFVKVAEEESALA